MYDASHIYDSKQEMFPVIYVMVVCGEFRVHFCMAGGVCVRHCRPLALSGDTCNARLLG